MQTPCRTCTSRVLHCHSTCEEYKGFRNKLDVVNGERRKMVQDAEKMIISVQRCKKKRRKTM